MRGVEGVWYKFINIHQRTETVETVLKNPCEYKFINIHQRTETQGNAVVLNDWYKFINIHQRTETATANGVGTAGVQIYQYPSENRNYF